MTDNHAYVYILECADTTFYIGWTVDLAARLKQHNTGKGAKYTRGRLPVTLVYSETLPSANEARKREVALKKLTRPQKLALIQRSGVGDQRSENARTQMNTDFQDEHRGFKN
jgi:putative endonuclease